MAAPEDVEHAVGPQTGKDGVRRALQGLGLGTADGVELSQDGFVIRRASLPQSCANPR